MERMKKARDAGQKAEYDVSLRMCSPARLSTRRVAKWRSRDAVEGARRAGRWMAADSGHFFSFLYPLSALAMPFTRFSPLLSLHSTRAHR